MASFLKFRAAAGSHARRACPVAVPVDLPAGAAVSVKEAESGRTVPGQCIQQDGQTVLAWVIDGLEAGEAREYLVSREPFPAAGGVTVAAVSDHRVDITIGGALFTSYHYSPDLARPYCYPVNDPAGGCVTRGHAGEKPGETTDHVHHRSLWTAYGEVNGTDNWGEAKGHGRTVHRGFDLMESGPVAGRLRARGDWTTAEGAVLLREVREFRFYRTGDERTRIFDLLLDLEAADGDVHFGDTKEGGFLSVRVATSMDASRDGRIENSYGAIGEAECWGRRACWCDYSGPVDGHWAGIAVMEHPGTFRSPTYWHVRDYGLMGTNPFGEGTFRGDPERSGAYTLPEGEHLRFLYRVAVHLGDAREAGIAEAYHQYINPPKVERCD